MSVSARSARSTSADSVTSCPRGGMRLCQHSVTSYPAPAHPGPVTTHPPALVSRLMRVAASPASSASSPYPHIGAGLSLRPAQPPEAPARRGPRPPERCERAKGPGPPERGAAFCMAGGAPPYRAPPGRGRSSSGFPYTPRRWLGAGPGPARGPWRTPGSGHVTRSPWPQQNSAGRRVASLNWCRP